MPLPRNRRIGKASSSSCEGSLTPRAGLQGSWSWVWEARLASPKRGFLQGWWITAGLIVRSSTLGRQLGPRNDQDCCFRFITSLFSMIFISALLLCCIALHCLALLAGVEITSLNVPRTCSTPAEALLRLLPSFLLPRALPSQQTRTDILISFRCFDWLPQWHS